MISDLTLTQLETLRLDRDGPLLICDVDEVVVHFTAPFEEFLDERGLYLETASFALSGNIRDKKTATPLTAAKETALIDEFFAEQTEHLPTIDGAVAALQEISTIASIVMLTNLPHHALDKRIANLRRHGLEFPCVTNSGPKGPAVRHLSRNIAGPVVFIDDSPTFIASCREHAPEVHLVHFLHDPRFARHHIPFSFVSLTTGAWDEALPHIRRLIG